MKRYVSAEVSSLSNCWNASGYFADWPNISPVIYQLQNPPALTQAWNALYAANKSVVLDMSSLTPGFAQKGFSCGTLVETTEVPPLVSRYEGKTRTNNNPGFAKKKATGVMVVAPYSAFKIEYSYTLGSLEGNTISTRSVSHNKAYDIDKALYWSLPRQFHHPFDKSSTPENNKYPQNDGNYFGPFTVKRVDSLTSEIHPKEIGWKDPFTSLSDFLSGSFDARECVTSAIADAESGTYDLLTEIAELPETLRYLINILGSAVDLFSAAKRREIEVRKLYRNRKQTLKSAKELADAVASVWLQYRYAIQPLAYSIEDIQETILSLKAQYGKFKGKETASVELPEELIFEGSGSVWKLTTNDSVQTMRCFIKRKYDPQDILDSLWSLLKVNPFSTAWELVPLSFVVDWFLNIGDYITALTSHSPHAQQVATLSYKFEGNATYVEENTGCTVDFSFECYRRSVIDPDDFVALRTRFDMNWKRQLDALALSWGPISERIKKNLNKR